MIFSGYTTNDLTMTESEAETGTLDLSRKRYSSRSPRQTPEHKHSPKSSPKMSPKRIGHRMDGYEADTDDTLQRRSRRKSVKELAGLFQRAENACPSPLPFRPKQYLGFDSDYDSDSKTTDSIVFNQSRAYIPPKWAPLEAPATPANVEKVETRSNEKSEKVDGTKILRLNQMPTDLSKMSSSSSSTFMESSSKFEASSSSSMMTSTSASFEASKSLTSSSEKTLTSTTTKSFSKEISSSFKSSTSGLEMKNSPPVIFTPKKFVPKTFGETPTAAGFEPSTDDSSKIKPKWSPSGSSTSAEPTYRKIRPIFDAGKVSESGGSLFKGAPGDAVAKVGDQVKVLQRLAIL